MAAIGGGLRLEATQSSPLQANIGHWRSNSRLTTGGLRIKSKQTVRDAHDDAGLLAALLAVDEQSRQAMLRAEADRLMAAIQSRRLAVQGLRLKMKDATATMAAGDKRSEAAVLRLIEIGRLQRLRRSLQTRYYTACQKIENTKRRISKIAHGFGLRQGSDTPDHELVSLMNCSESQLEEMLDCESQEFKSKIEFEQKLKEILIEKLTKLESLDQAKSLIRQIAGEASPIHETKAKQILATMKENKNTMTTEKIVMLNKPSNNKQDLDISDGQSEQTYSPPRATRLDFRSKRAAVKALPEVRSAIHKRTNSEDIPRDMFLAQRWLDPSRRSSRHRQEANDQSYAGALTLNINDSAVDFERGLLDHHLALTPQKPKALVRRGQTERRSQLFAREIPSVQRKKLQLSLSSGKLPDISVSREGKLKANRKVKETNLSLTYLPAIRVHATRNKKSNLATKLVETVNQPDTLLSLSLENAMSAKQVDVSASRIGPEIGQSPFYYQTEGQEGEKLVSTATGKPAKALVGHNNEQEPSQTKLGSAHERMVNKIQRFLPDNSSIEERMVESSKRSAQDPEVKRLSQIGQTSGSNENSSMRLIDRTDNMNVTKVSDENASQRVGPGVSQPEKISNAGQSVEIARNNDKGGTLVKKVTGNQSPGSPFGKSKLAQARRSEGPLTNGGSLQAFQAGRVSRRASPSLTLVSKSGVQQTKTSPRAKGFFAKPDDESQSKATPPEPSHRDRSERHKAEEDRQNTPSEELDLRSRRSDLDASGTSGRLSKIDRSLIYRRGNGKKDTITARPEWKGDHESELRFISYSDD